MRFMKATEMKFLVAVHIGQLIGALFFGMTLTALCLDKKENVKLPLTTISVLHMSLQELARAEI